MIVGGIRDVVPGFSVAESELNFEPARIVMARPDVRVVRVCLGVGLWGGGVGHRAAVWGVDILLVGRLVVVLRWRGGRDGCQWRTVLKAWNKETRRRGLMSLSRDVELWWRRNYWQLCKFKRKKPAHE